MSRRIPAWLAAAAATAFVAVLVGGAVAIGALPDSKGRINACYVKSGERKGDVRLLVSGKCRPGEKKVSWNQEGPPGEDGVSGATKVLVRSVPLFCRSGACTRSTAVATCQPGERATGGGGRVTSAGDRLTETRPNAETSIPTGWEVGIDDGNGDGGISGSVYVLCASP